MISCTCSAFMYSLANHEKPSAWDSHIHSYTSRHIYIYSFHRRHKVFIVGGEPFTSARPRHSVKKKKNILSKSTENKLKIKMNWQRWRRGQGWREAAASTQWYFDAWSWAKLKQYRRTCTHAHTWTLFAPFAGETFIWPWIREQCRIIAQRQTPQWSEPCCPRAHGAHHRAHDCYMRASVCECVCVARFEWSPQLYRTATIQQQNDECRLQEGGATYSHTERSNIRAATTINSFTDKTALFPRFFSDCCYARYSMPI